MNNRFIKLAALTAVGTLAFAACGNNNPTSTSSSSAGGASSQATQQLSGTLTGGGASTQQAAMDAWKAGFTATQPKVSVQYSPSGSGAGVKAFLAGQQAFANSDKSLSADEWTESKKQCGDQGGLNIPVYVSPIAVVFNVKGVDKSLKMSPELIANIFAGKVATWDDEAIKKENPDVQLPSTKITPVHRAEKSGTTFNFTDYLNQTAPGAWADKPAETWPDAIKGGETGQGTSGLVKVVQSTDGAIGYADASAIGQLKTVMPKVGSDYSTMSAEAAAKILDSSTKTGGQSPNDMAYTIDRKTTNSAAYPIVLVSYQIFCNQYKDKAMGENAKAFATYVVSSAGQKEAAKAAGSAPISDALSKAATEAINNIKVG